MSLQQKVRVKLLKLLVVKNPMPKTEKSVEGKKKKIKWTKPAGLRPKEIGPTFCNASRNKKTLKRDSSSSKNDRHGDADALDECMEERDQLIVSGKKGNMFKTLLEDSMERLTLSKSCSFKKILRIIDKKGEMSKTANWASIKRQPAGYCIIRRVKSIPENGETGERIKHQDEEEQEKVELELCKKRILMGGKCRPLSASGSLHYDQNGILLPELPYQEL